MQISQQRKLRSLWNLRLIAKRQTCKKIIFVRELNFGFKMSGQFIWKNSLDWGFLESILGCVMHEYSEIGIYFNLIFSISIQNFDKVSKNLWFPKNVRIFLQKCPGSRIPGSQLFACLLLKLVCFPVGSYPSSYWLETTWWFLHHL